MEPNISYLAAFVAGISIHALYLRRGEHHLQGFFYFKLFLASVVTVAALLPSAVYPSTSSFTVSNWELLEWKREFAWRTSFTIHLVFLSGIFISLFTYRVFFHPLRTFPGPLDLKLSALALSFRVFRRQDAHKVVLRLHAQHGDFVRIGPSAISSIHAETPSVIHNAATHGFSKGEFYDLMKPFKPLQMIRDKTEHNARRRVWSAAFGERALRGYEQRIKVYQDKMMGVFTTAAERQEKIDVTQVFHAYSFDVIGDLALGMKFGLLDSESKGHWAVDLLGEAVEVVAYMPPVWLFRFFFDIPGLNARWNKWLGFCRETLVERMKNPPAIPDIMSAFLAPLGDKKPSEEDMTVLVSDAHLVIGAGSETTFAALAMMAYLLARHPEHQQKLREEVLPFMVTSGSSVTFSSESLASLDHLNGIINETLRFYPALPTAAARKAPPEGAMIGGRYIPGGTEVWCPQYTLGRNEAIFEKSQEFIPERWYQYPDMVKDKNAFAPFLLGPMSCIGKPLALQNIRTTMARLVCAFDITFPAGMDPDAWEATVSDHFSLGVPALPLVLTKRGS